jgi:hypothetical protein
MDKEQIPEKITLPSMNKILVFKPRPSTGWLWLIGLALLVVGPIIGMILPSLNQVPLWPMGLVLFTAFYRDVGRVKMCATATLTHILLIETDQGLYGLTPADATTFMAAIRTRLEE